MPGHHAPDGESGQESSGHRPRNGSHRDNGEAGPVSRPLTDLLAVTYGPLPVLTDLLSEVAGVDQAYIYGSWAARYRKT
jgi:hypothetical protein